MVSVWTAKGAEGGCAVAGIGDVAHVVEGVGNVLYERGGPAVVGCCPEPCEPLQVVVGVFRVAQVAVLNTAAVAETVVEDAVDVAVRNTVLDSRHG